MGRATLRNGAAVTQGVPRLCIRRSKLHVQLFNVRHPCGETRTPRPQRLWLTTMNRTKREALPLRRSGLNPQMTAASFLPGPAQVRLARSRHVSQRAFGGLAHYQPTFLSTQASAVRSAVWERLGNLPHGSPSQTQLRGEDCRQIRSSRHRQWAENCKSPVGDRQQPTSPA